MSRGGQTLVLVLCLAVLVEFFPGLSWAVGFIILGLLALSCALVYATFRPGAVELHFTPRTQSQAGEILEVSVSLVNPSKRSLYGMGLQFQRLPDGLEIEGPPPYIHEILPHQQRELTLKLKTLRRGSYQLNTLMILQIDPLGLINRRRSHPIQWTLEVLPAKIQTTQAPWHGTHFWQQLTRTHALGLETQNQFKGLRHYQSGDSKKQIHHKSWARIGTPVVRDFHTEHPLPDLHLVLDAQVPSLWHKPSFEILLQHYFAFQAPLLLQNYSLHYHIIQESHQVLEDVAHLNPHLSRIKAQVRGLDTPYLINKLLEDQSDSMVLVFTTQALTPPENPLHYLLVGTDQGPSQALQAQHYQLGVG